MLSHKRKYLAAFITLIIILTNAFCGADLIITAEDIGNGRLRIGYDATTEAALPAGFNLSIQLSNGALILTEDDVLSTDEHFPLFMDQVYETASGYTLGSGSPLADLNQPGKPAMPASDFALVLGAVDTQNIPTISTNLTTLQLWGYGEVTDTTVTISANSSRGGVVNCTWAGDQCTIGSSAIQTVTTNVDLTDSQIQPEEIVIDRCLVKADTSREPGHDFRDSIIIMASSMTELTEDTLAAAENLTVSISNSQNDVILNETITLQNNNDVRLVKGRLIYKARTGNVSLLMIDTAKDMLTLMSQNVNLTGLDSPVRLDIQIQEYRATAEVADSADGTPDALNSKANIPVSLQTGYADSLAITRSIFKSNPKTGLDTLVVLGEIALLDAAAVDLTTTDVTLTWGDYNVTIPAANMIQLKTLPRFLYKAPRGSDNPVSKALFDFDRGTFQIIIKNAPIGDQDSPVTFGLSFGDFEQTVSVTP